MDTVTQIQILDKSVCISHGTNMLVKGMKPSFSLQLRVNSRGRLDFLTLVEEKEKSEFKPVKLHLKTDLVSHPACVCGGG